MCVCVVLRAFCVLCVLTAVGGRNRHTTPNTERQITHSTWTAPLVDPLEGDRLRLAHLQCRTFWWDLTSALALEQVVGSPSRGLHPCGGRLGHRRLNTGPVRLCRSTLLTCDRGINAQRLLCLI